MGQCFDAKNNIYVYCTSHLSTYVAVGVIIPAIILFMLGLAYLYVRCRRKVLRRQQQTQMPTVMPIHNHDEQQPPYNYPYPPQYASTDQDFFDKPPSYEQTIQQVSETQPHVSNVNTAAAAVVLPTASPPLAPETFRTEH